MSRTTTFGKRLDKSNTLFDDLEKEVMTASRAICLPATPISHSKRLPELTLVQSKSYAQSPMIKTGFRPYDGYHY